MDWNNMYEKVSGLMGMANPYGCTNEAVCNHVAKNNFGMMWHYRYGNHHLNHKTR